MLEETLESPLDFKKIKPDNPKGNQLWVFIGRTDAETPTLWPPDMKSWFIGKDPDAETGQQRMTWLDSITDSMGMNLSKLQEIVKDSEALCAAVQRVRHHLATEPLSNWTTTTDCFEELCWWLSGKCRRNGYDSLVGRSPGKGNGNPLQYSRLGNLMERGVWCAAVHRVTKELNTT